MTDEKEFFERVNEPEVEFTEVRNNDNNLDVKVKNLRDDAMNIYALIISDPKKHGHAVDELRRNFMALAATLLEHGVRLELPKKDRNAEDVIKEAAGELGSMFGAQGVTYGLSFINRVRENIATSKEEEVVIYEDEDTGALYFIDENGDEVECDEYGEPLEGE
jgi:hypothetical protein|tara:strand:+ start:1925 stop:2413 length:489 start_codon:yes stop_codon:yes gene_type:complete